MECPERLVDGVVLDVQAWKMNGAWSEQSAKGRGLRWSSDYTFVQYSEGACMGEIPRGMYYVYVKYI